MYYQYIFQLSILYFYLAINSIVGAAVKLAEEKRVLLDQLTVTELQSLHPSFGDDITLIWSYEARLFSLTIYTLMCIEFFCDVAWRVETQLEALQGREC